MLNMYRLKVGKRSVENAVETMQPVHKGSRTRFKTGWRKIVEANPKIDKKSHMFNLMIHRERLANSRGSQHVIRDRRKLANT